MIPKRLVMLLIALICLIGGVASNSQTILGAGALNNGLSDQQASLLLPQPESKIVAWFPIVFQGSEAESELRFTVIGDYGKANQAEADVADLIKSWKPDLIITTGDNNYPDGAAGTIDENIGQFFHEFIAPYKGSYGEGGQENRFFPSLGNHDWHSPGVKPYLDYFTLPGNKRYYDFIWGPVHFFALDSDSSEPDGASIGSIQADWLQSKLSVSDSPWKVVYFHHAPYSSGRHGPSERMQWPFAEWGADVVLSGHDHTYERISRDGIYYFVNGLGGASRYQFVSIVEGSELRYNEDHGAMLVEVRGKVMHVQFVNRQGTVIDDLELTIP
jgi:tartrate-resistant acid phosphatase type 5